MEVIFVKFFNMSLVASWLILAVIILRLILKNAPKWIRCVMWAMVALRLIVPFSFESGFSLVPNAQKLNQTSHSSTSYIGADISGNSGIFDTAVQAENSSNDIFTIISLVWVVGVALLLFYMVFSYFSLSRKVCERIRLRDNIWICDRIKSPFVLGIFRPQIYLLSSMSEKEAEYVVAHEKAHLRRLDNIWKPLGFLLLCIHWFNPLCWLAYGLFNKDIELACDESVIRGLDLRGKKEYSTALLMCSSARHTVSACPLAFGENNIKQRIKSVLSYRKPAFRVVVIAFAACAAVAISFMTDPLSSKAVNTVLEGLGSDNATVLPVRMDATDISDLELNKIYSLISDSVEENASDNVQIEKVELNEENREISVYIKNLDDSKQKWFEENICDTPYVVFVNVKDESKEKPTELATQNQTQPATDDVTDDASDYESYDDGYSDYDYTDDYSDYGYSDNGYDDSYSDYTDDYSDYSSDSGNNSDIDRISEGIRILEETPFEPQYDTSVEEAYREVREQIERSVPKNENNDSEIWRDTQWDY